MAVFLLCEEFYFLGFNVCNALKVNRRFGRTCRPYFKVDECKPSKKPASEQVARRALTLFFDPAYSSTVKMETVFLRNIGLLPTHCTALYPRRYRCGNLKSYIITTHAFHSENRKERDCWET
jgi:hypothetical protein